MSINTMMSLPEIADAITAELYAQLKSGALAKIGIEEIQVAIRQRGAWNTAEWQRLEELTTRKVCWKAERL